MGDHVTVVDPRAVVATAALIVLCVLFAGVVARRIGTSWFAALAALCSVALIVAVTITNRGVIISTDPPVHELSWWTRGWHGVAQRAVHDIDWWLNVVLFVPAGVIWTAVTRKPIRVLIALGALSFAIESLQSTVLTGIPDVADLIANSGGAFIGVVLGVVVIVGRPLFSAASSGLARRGPLRR